MKNDASSKNDDPADAYPLGLAWLQNYLPKFDTEAVKPDQK